MTTHFLPRIPLPRFLLPSLPKMQIRTKTKLKRQPRGVAVRLHRDVKGFGPKGAIVRVLPGRMRNDWLPRHIATYVPNAELTELNIEKKNVQRDYGFIPRGRRKNLGLQETEGDDARGGEEQALAKEQKEKIPSLDPRQIMTLIRNSVPGTLTFKRQAIGRAASLSNAGEGESVEDASHAEREPQALYGSVSKLDVVNAIKDALKKSEGDEGALVNFEPEDVELKNAEAGDGRVTHDRIKLRGKFVAEVRVKGASGLARKEIIVEAEEM